MAKVKTEIRALIGKTVEELKKLPGTEFLVCLVESIDEFVDAKGLNTESSGIKI